MVRKQKKAGSRFLRSTNIERDTERAEALDQYVITGNALHAIERVTRAITDGRGGAWTLTGPFGTGKSSFLLFLAHLLAPARTPTTSRAVSMLKSVSAKVAAKAFPTKSTRHGLVPVTVSGAAEPVTTSVLRGLRTAVKQAGLPIANKLHRALTRAAKRSQAGEAIPGTELLEFLEALMDQATSRAPHCKGFLLILDELGKMLEYAAESGDRADVFVLQQIAELAARSDGKLLLITALHQDFRAYANRLPPEDRAEWEKIRGRFEDIAFQEPPDQLLRFLSLAWERLQADRGLQVLPGARRTTSELAACLWDMELNPTGLDKQAGRALVSACAPLHPLVAVLLGPLFRRIGQNERSSFSFLASSEPRGLQDVLAKSNGSVKLFDIVDLYAYLSSAFGNALLTTPDSKRWAEAMEAEARNPQLGGEAIAVLRAVALLGIASRWSSAKPTPAVLEYALADRHTKATVRKVLRELQAASILTRRRYNNTYALWEGSDVDVEASLAEGRDRVRGTGSLAALLRKEFTSRPILARRHSFEKGTLRFFAMQFLTLEELASDRLPEQNLCDGRLLLVVNEQNQGRVTPADLENLGPLDLVRTLQGASELTSLALELGAAEWVRQNTPELAGDATARRELHARIRAVRRSIDELITDTIGLGGGIDGTWYHQGREVSIHNSRDLNEKLSAACDSVYSNAPRIDNEIINRRELSSSAAAARRKLLERMILNSDLAQLGMEGNPPEMSIYRSVLSEEGPLKLHKQAEGGWGFRWPDKRSDARDLFREIRRFFEGALEEPRTFEELFGLLRRPPFGLRDGVIPVLGCAALLMAEAEVAVYEEGRFCPRLEPAMFDRLVKTPSRFSLRQWRLGGVRARLFTQLEKLVLDTPERSPDSKKRLLGVAKPLFRFVSALPRYVMRTRELSDRTKAIRDVFVQASEPDALFFEQLPEACGLKPFAAEGASWDREADVVHYVTALKEAVAELRGAMPALTASVRGAIGEGFGVASNDIAEARNALQAKAAALLPYVVERDLKLLCSRFSETDATDDNWALGVAAFLAEKPPEKWGDEDRAHFGVRLRQFARRLDLLEATIADRPPDAAQDMESFRISVTGISFGHVAHSVHLPLGDRDEVSELEGRIEAALAADSREPATVAALCRVLKRQLTQQRNAQKGESN